ncbi:MAG: hypothetical protein J5764_01170 [Bacteroidales bacterium]|nr:hypothetical protein [Bacteroidales bacterium]
MKKNTMISYESPTMECPSLQMDSALLTGSTGESYTTLDDKSYVDSTWNWEI